MKYCDLCEKEFDTEENICPVCGTEVTELSAEDETNEYEAAEIISTMMTTGIL